MQCYVLGRDENGYHVKLREEPFVPTAAAYLLGNLCAVLGHPFERFRLTNALLTKAIFWPSDSGKTLSTVTVSREQALAINPEQVANFDLSDEIDAELAEEAAECN